MTHQVLLDDRVMCRLILKKEGRVVILKSKMTEPKRRAVLWAQSILCVAITLLLCTDLVMILRSGLALKQTDPMADIYTPQALSNALFHCLPLILLSFALTVAAVLMSVRIKEKPFQDAETVRDLLCKKIKEPSPLIEKERRVQRTLHVIGWCCFGLCMVPVLIYLCIPSHFAAADAKGLSQTIFTLLCHILPWTLISIGALSVCLILRDKSILRETEAAREIIKSSDRQKIQDETALKDMMQTSENKKAGKGVMILRLGILLTAVVLIVMGIMNGSAQDVLNKAVVICTECIGLG